MVEKSLLTRRSRSGWLAGWLGCLAWLAAWLVAGSPGPNA